jgi:hypothetical protein
VSFCVISGYFELKWHGSQSLFAVKVPTPPSFGSTIRFFFSLSGLLDQPVEMPWWHGTQLTLSA